MISTQFRNIIHFASNILILILDKINPLLGLVANVIKIALIKDESNLVNDEVLITQITSPNIPKDFAANIAKGTISDAIEASSVKSAMDYAVPFI